MALTLTYTDGRGRELKRVVHTQIADIRAFEGKAILPWLVIAANPHLSVNELFEVLVNFGRDYIRSTSWIKRRRWMAHGNLPAGARPNADGKDDRALAIMRDNRDLSARKLVQVLAERGIRRGRDWVLRHRVD